MQALDSWNPNPDVAGAATPPPAIYTDPCIQEALIERVLARSWHVLALRSGPGLRPVSLLPGSLDEALVLVETAGAPPRAFSNICTHRGHPIVQEEGPVGTMRCGYHGRCFDPHGRALRAPGFPPESGFPREDDHLPEVALQTLGPLLWANLAPSAESTEALAALTERLAWLPWDRAQPASELDRDYQVSANWLLYCENYLEGLHIPFVHKGLSAALDLKTYGYEQHPWGSLQWSQGADPAGPSLRASDGTVDGGIELAALYLYVFPTTMLNVYPWGLSLNRIEPMGPNQTRVRFQSLVWDESCLEAGAGTGLHAVEMEDEAVIERVQQGMRSRLFRGGNYSPAHEAGVHHLHRMLHRVLSDGA